MNTKPQSLSHDGQGCIMARAKHGSHRVLIAKCEPDGMEYAALIVRAVNRDHAFEQLLEACKSIANQCDGDLNDMAYRAFADHVVRAAITQAEPFTH